MFNLKLDKDKQKILETFFGDNYKKLHTYQKWMLQFHLTEQDVKRFKKIEEIVKNAKDESDQNNECN
jgi:hypothetical protein